MTGTQRQWAGAALCALAVAWWGLGGPALTQSRERATQAELVGRLKAAAVPWSALETERQRAMASVVVSGAGDAGYNGRYVESGTYNGKPAYMLDSGHWLYWADLGGGTWVWALASSKTNPLTTPAYFGTGTDLPANTWTAGGGTAPAPTVTLVAAFPSSLTLSINTPVADVILAGAFDLTYTIGALFADWSAGLFSVAADLDGVSLGTGSVTLTDYFGFSSATGTLTGLDSTAVADGTRTLRLTAWQLAGGETLEDSHDVQVQNAAPATARPTCQITAPAAGGVLRGSENVYVVAKDQTALANVKLYLDYGTAGETLLHTWTTSAASYSGYCTVDTTAYQSGDHTLTAVAENGSGTLGVSSPVAVVVQNGSLPVADGGDWVYRAKADMAASGSDGVAWCVLRVGAEEWEFPYPMMLQRMAGGSGSGWQYLVGSSRPGDMVDFAGGDGVGEIRVQRDAAGDLWEIYVDDVLKASGQLPASMAMYHWDTVQVEAHRSPRGTTEAGVDSADVYWGSKHRRWDFDGDAELHEWNIHHDADSLVAGGELTCDIGKSARVVGRFRPPCPPSVAVCLGPDATLWAAVAVHSGMQTNPTVRVYRKQNTKTWALWATAATPEDLGGTGEQDRTRTALWWSGWPTWADVEQEYLRGSVMVVSLEQRPDAALVIGLGRNPHRVLLNATDPNTTPTYSDCGTWWLVSATTGVQWELLKNGTLGADKRLAGCQHDALGRVWCHLVETGLDGYSGKVRHWAAVGRTGLFSLLHEEAVGDAAWPGSENSEAVDGWMEQRRDGTLLAAPTEPYNAASWAVGMPDGYSWEQKSRTATAYMPGYMETDGAGRWPGIPALTLGSDTGGHAVWRGYKQNYGSILDATHLWDVPLTGPDVYPEAVEQAAAPTREICELTEEQLRLSQVQIIAAPNAELRCFVNVYGADELREYASCNSGETWTLREILSIA